MDEIVRYLEVLTKRTDLRSLTLSAWSNAIDMSGTLRNKKAWCPDCYDEWARAGRTIYDPLLWAFKEITCCVRHGKRLRDTCPHMDCNRSILPLGVKASHPGYCSYCKRWLGTSIDLPPALGTEQMWQQWLTDTIGGLLANTRIAHSPPSRQQLGDALAMVIRQTCDGNTANFARLIGSSNNNVQSWVRQSSKPRLEAALRMCFALRIPLSDLLARDPTTLDLVPMDPISRYPVRSRRTCPESTRADLKRLLQNAAASDEYPPVSVTEIARRLDCTRDLLQACDQEACRTISERYKAYLHHRQEQRIHEACEEVRRAAQQLRSQGLPVNESLVKRQLSQPNMLRDQKVREVYLQLREERQIYGNGPL